MEVEASSARAQRFALALNLCRCWSCEAETRVARLVIGPSAREDADAWDNDEPSAITYIETMNSDAVEAAQLLAPWMRWLSSNSMQSTYFGNACEHCGVLQGEHFLGEPGGPFFPLTDEEAAAIRMEWIDVPIEARAGGQSMGVVWMREPPKLPRKRARKRKV